MFKGQISVSAKRQNLNRAMLIAHQALGESHPVTKALKAEFHGLENDPLKRRINAKTTNHENVRFAQ